MALADTCDRHPSALAYTSWHSVATKAVLWLCNHCTNTNDLALLEQCFELDVDRRADLAKFAGVSPG